MQAASIRAVLGRIATTENTHGAVGKTVKQRHCDAFAVAELLVLIPVYRHTYLCCNLKTYKKNYKHTHFQ